MIPDVIIGTSIRAYRPTKDDFFDIPKEAGGSPPGLKALRKLPASSLIILPCPPQKRCKVCEGRVRKEAA